MGLTTRLQGFADVSTAFKYLTPKLRLTDGDLSPSLLRSKTFHLICSPLRCVELVEGIRSRRSALDASLPAPLFIWEPVPDLCVPGELDNTLEALKHVDVISPNHAELAELCSVNADAEGGGVNRDIVEACSARLLKGIEGRGQESKLAVVVRSGKDGCYVSSASGAARWLPAFHTSAANVVDPTGGGNGFLGGLAVGLARTGDVITAAMWGNVAASFCIEQVGVPVLGKGVDGEETWNGVVVRERLVGFEKRCAGE